MFEITGNVELDDYIDHLVPWSCVPKLQLLLKKVNLDTLTEEQLNGLLYYRENIIPPISPSIAIAFLHGKSAVAIIRGIRDKKWTVECVQEALIKYLELRSEPAITLE